MATHCCRTRLSCPTAETSSRRMRCTSSSARSTRTNPLCATPARACAQHMPGVRVGQHGAGQHPALPRGDGVWRARHSPLSHGQGRCLVHRAGSFTEQQRDVASIRAEYPLLMVRHGAAVFRSEWDGARCGGCHVSAVRRARCGSWRRPSKLSPRSTSRCCTRHWCRCRLCPALHGRKHSLSVQEKTGRWHGMYHSALKLLDMKAPHTLATYNRLCSLSLMDVCCCARSIADVAQFQRTNRLHPELNESQTRGLQRFCHAAHQLSKSDPESLRNVRAELRQAIPLKPGRWGCWLQSRAISQRLWTTCVGRTPCSATICQSHTTWPTSADCVPRGPGMSRLLMMRSDPEFHGLDKTTKYARLLGESGSCQHPQ